ncbi:hypothetical protein Anapl_15584 [Anas platyrhynchos]|uniref:Uncharacterized protein n=1 Tax=Anas platyrhynchos TaxID=8839 RepID=R0JP07_ANAPL|nr:hypothetical protein Anapl_15584 [Anas platyrhynchos]
MHMIFYTPTCCTSLKRGSQHVDTRLLREDSTIKNLVPEGNNGTSTWINASSGLDGRGFVSLAQSLVQMDPKTSSIVLQPCPSTALPMERKKQMKKILLRPVQRDKCSFLLVAKLLEHGNNQRAHQAPLSKLKFLLVSIQAVAALHLSASSALKLSYSRLLIDTKSNSICFHPDKDSSEVALLSTCDFAALRREQRALTTPPEIPSFGHVTSPSCMPHLSQPITKLNLHQVTLLLADAIPVLLWPGTTTFKLSMADFAHYKRNTDLQGAHKAFGDRD